MWNFNFKNSTGTFIHTKPQHIQIICWIWADLQLPRNCDFAAALSISVAYWSLVSYQTRPFLLTCDYFWHSDGTIDVWSHTFIGPVRDSHFTAYCRDFSCSFWLRSPEFVLLLSFDRMIISFCIWLRWTDTCRASLLRCCQVCHLSSLLLVCCMLTSHSYQTLWMTHFFTCCSVSVHLIHIY